MARTTLKTLAAGQRVTNPTKSRLGTSLRRRFWNRAIIGLLPLLLICSRSFGNQGTLNVIRIGYQKYGSFNVVKARHTFDDRLAKRGIKINWIYFQPVRNSLKR